ncbi:glycosyl transferase [Streptomyces lunaelactis]|uniref:macrolide family glycosyltransferase n=1 Tax=Streptomyces lunaelactis TaxID=1535768 RepID=UPI0015858D43|nr:macrolide family glycosyltransferase [Streptomyces lunaelactis]NUK50771.1 glycosyl transferase [Streptomyces lunaelactis]NUK65097.1 glycosyl transferase [Streptomyces lunaelactis]
MNSSHIAMFSVGTHGHVQPNIEVIRELVDRGHRVTYSIPEAFAELVASTGAEPRIYTSSLPPRDEPGAWGTDMLDHLRQFLADSGRVLPQLLRAYEHDRPDLILYDPVAYAARVLADRWQVPDVQLSPTAVGWDGDVDVEESAADRWLAVNQLGLGRQRGARRPRRCIALISKSLQPHADLVDSSVYDFTGPCRGRSTRHGDWQRPADAERVVLISLGTIYTHAPEFYRECLAAFGDLPGWHVVLQVGKSLDTDALGPVPENVELCEWFPQLRVLEQTDAFITHAGASSAHDGLACGVPMVAVPQAADQFTNARMLERLGVARRLTKEEATAQTLRKTVLALLDDPRTAEQCALARREMAAEGGTRRAADLIEAELPGR